MARRKKQENNEKVIDFSGVAQTIEESPMHDFLKENFLSYALTTIHDRALPDVRDGLKPVHRRILWSMFLDGCVPTKAHVKSAKIAGSVVGNFHPHGTAATYGAMVSLVTTYNNNLNLCEGHGNFGNSPGENPAADRYTEARLSKAAISMLEDIKENAVDMVWNYDGSRQEPSVLPVTLPMLLINGCSGIATGIATNIPPHNPKEISELALLMLRKEKISIDEVLEIVPGPDFPTGGTIIGKDGIKEAYETGRGKLHIQCKYQIEPTSRGKHNIIVTEMPYNVSIEKVKEEIKNGIEKNKLVGISNVLDLSDRIHGLRFVIETKAGINPEALIIDLLASTSLQISFSTNAMVLTPDNEPKQVGIIEMMRFFLNHREDVIRKRTESRLIKINDRIHVLEGLEKALQDIDKIIKIVRKSENSEKAKTELKKQFKISETQANSILAISLSRLTKYDSIQVLNEMEKLKKEKEKLEKIILVNSEMKKTIREEIRESMKTLENSRHSLIENIDFEEYKKTLKTQKASKNVEIEEKECFIVISPEGKIGRFSSKKSTEKIPAQSIVKSTTKSEVVLLTNKGTGYKINTVHLSNDKTVDISTLGINVAKDEHVVSVSAFDMKDKFGIVMATKKGLIKALNTVWPKRGEEYSVLELVDDEIIAADWVDKPENKFATFVTSDCKLLKVKLETIRTQKSLGGQGIAGIKLSPGEHVVNFSISENDDEVLTITDNNMMKKTLLSEFPVKGRATGGVRCHKLNKNGNCIKTAAIGKNVSLKTNNNKIIKVENEEKRDSPGIETDPGNIAINFK